MRPKKGPLLPKFTKVTCRYCGPEKQQISRQYYPEHLVLVHQDRTGNLREHGQQSLSFASFSRSKSQEKSQDRSRKRSSTRSRSRSRNEKRQKSRSRSTSSQAPPVTITHDRRSSSQRSRSSSQRSRSSTSSQRSRFTQEGRSASSSSSSEGEEEDRVKVRKLLDENRRLKDGKEWISRRMEGLSNQVDNILEKSGITVDTRDCENCGYQQMSKKLEVIERFVSAQSLVKNLEKCFQDLKVVCSTSQPAGEDSVEDLANLFRKVESVGEMFNKCPEFEMQGEKVVCKVCDKNITKYAENLDKDFQGLNQKPRYFRNLKTVVKRHLLNSEEHKSKLQKQDIKEQQEERVMSREKRISRVLGDVSFYLGKKGRAYGDFPLIVNILAHAGVDVGDINHSEKFPLKFCKELESVIMERLKKFLSTPMVQTGQKTPVKGVADKATYKHDSRMYGGVVTVVPDSIQNIQGFITTAEVCPGSSGKEQSSCLIQSYDQYITGPQVFIYSFLLRFAFFFETFVAKKLIYLQWNGLCADGHTLHCNVGKLLNRHFGREGHDDGDKMHRWVCRGVYLRLSESFFL